MTLDALIERARTASGYQFDDCFTPYLKEELGSEACYTVECKTVEDVYRFNFHGDYWGTASQYEEENIAAMEEFAPYIGQPIDTPDGTQVKIAAMLINQRYNSVGHTDLLIEEVRS